MTRKILIFSAAALMAVGAVAYGLQSQGKTTCPLEGRPDCPKVSCPLNGSPICPYEDGKDKMPSCCQKQ